MFRCFAAILFVVSFSLCLASCQGTGAGAEGYTLVVLSDTGQPLEGAWVTPVAFGRNYKVKHTTYDGSVNLSADYPAKPYSISIQMIGYQTFSLDWPFPSSAPVLVTLKKGP